MSDVIHSYQGRFARATLLRPAAPVAVHNHPQIQIVLPVSGAPVTYRVEEATIALDPDRFLLINPWVAHARAGAGPGTDGLLLALSLEGSWLGLPPTRPVDGDPPRLTAAPTGAIDAETRDVLTRFVAALRTHKERSDAEAGGAAEAWDLEGPLTALLTALLGPGLETARPIGGRPPLPVGARPIDQRIWRAIGLMRHTICKEPGIDAIAVQAGLSRSRFFEQFRACCGVTPRTYADTLMIEEAARRLTEGEGSIAEISDALGFSAQSHFTRFFRHKTGISPSLYRRATRGYRDRPRRLGAALADDDGPERLAGA